VPALGGPPAQPGPPNGCAIAPVSSHTRRVRGHLWEIERARNEGKPIRGLSIEDGNRTQVACPRRHSLPQSDPANATTFIDSI
jgi:hypothetical protein